MFKLNWTQTQLRVCFCFFLQSWVFGPDVNLLVDTVFDCQRVMVFMAFWEGNSWDGIGPIKAIHFFAEGSMQRSQQQPAGFSLSQVRFTEGGYLRA